MKTLKKHTSQKLCGKLCDIWNGGWLYPQSFFTRQPEPKPEDCNGGQKRVGQPIWSLEI